MVIIGGSGTGKSLMLKCVLGLVTLDAGTITVNGADVTKGDPGAFLAKFGMLFQGGALFDSLTVWQNVAFRLLHGPSETSSPLGKFAQQVLGAAAEFEHALICGRTRAGPASARARGRRGGNPVLRAKHPIALRKVWSA